MDLNIILRSKYYGAGKTFVAVSMYNPEKLPAKRLVYDGEARARNYQGDEDDPENARFKFDLWEDRYDGDFYENLVSFINEIDELPYNVVAFDNASVFQDDLYGVMSNKRRAMAVTDALGISGRFSTFLQYRFSTKDTASYYNLLKGVIREFLLKLRRRGIDVVVTSETRNVWKNYGSRDRNNPPTILGQTAKVWDPWMQLSDLILVLDRTRGDRLSGNATLSKYPMASLDTFNTKCSIVGIPPKFVLKNWDIFWEFANARNIVTEEQMKEVDVPLAIENNPVETIDDAKFGITQHAIRKGVPEKGLSAWLKRVGEKYDLSSENAISEYWDWIEAIDEETDE